MSALKLCPTCGTEYPANERFCPKDGTALRSQGGGTDLVGSIIADRYHVLKKLGEGGMGQVYLAEHVKMGRKSAVKVMNPGMVQDADAISRFNREASNASRINHQHVAGIYDFGETAEGLIYLAMEYVEGEPLTALVSRSGALPPARAAELTRQTGEALSVAHDMGIVHRDLKPDNIMITRSRDGTDCVKVVDFGIAKAANVEAQKVTRTGLVVGTPEYMSPEQLAGDPLDGRSDVYSLGLVAFNMLTGQLPFPSETVQESMIMRLTDRPRRLGEMRPETDWPAEVQAVMDHALERDTSARYASASEFGRALQAAVNGMPASVATPGRTAVIPNAAGVPATRVSGTLPPPRASGVPTMVKSRVPMLAGAGVLVVALLGMGVVFMNGRVTNGSSTAATQTASVPAPTPLSATLPAPPPSAAKETVGRPAASGRAPLGAPSVTAEATSQSYAIELIRLERSIKDSASAMLVRGKLSEWKNKVRLASDRVILQVVEAEVAGMIEDPSACTLWRRIPREDVVEQLRNTYSESMKNCDGT
ncbi:MAG: protein kinase [Gemmatimonadaceae bacterium]